jgi:RND family efflux transporter MFP subunit
MRTAILSVFLGLTAILAGCSNRAAETAAQAVEAGPQPLAVRTAKAEARTVERAIMVTGSLHPDETTAVSAEVPGRVLKINYDFGQAVRRGEVVAELDTQELRLQLEKVKATLAQALARVGLDPADGDRTPESTPMMRQARAQMEDARSKFEKAQKLIQSGDISRERYTEIEKQYHARLAAYEASGDELRTQMAVVRSLRAEVALAEKRVRDATVVAPFDGTVSQRHAAAGQYIRENVPILTLVKTRPLRLRVEAPESAVRDVKPGTPLVFTTEAVPGAQFKAVVRQLNPGLDSRSRTLTAEARLVQDDPRLTPGAFVQVRLVASQSFPVVALPKPAVYTVAGLNKFFTIENGKAVERRIGEIIASDGFVEIPAGSIPGGAEVAVSNVTLLTNGAPVRVENGGEGRR